MSVFGSERVTKAVDEAIIIALRAMAKGMHGYWQQFTTTAFAGCINVKHLNA
ncbi:hypothetical protein [Moorena producens]|uniref:hypothetical protein n=1 Tax=Moorena producens TaxID=1155739 RepID=UPI00131428D3|nr:hypothetical protein [Moorena producens]